MDLWEILEYVGESLVFVGVVGEVFAEWREPHRKTLGKASSLVLVLGLALSLAALRGTNGDFEGKIADANLKASQADERSENLKKDNLTLQRDIADANDRAGDAEKKAAQLRKDAEAERLERMKLEAVVNPRRLTTEQEKNIADSLKSYTGKTVMVATYSQDVEAMILATQIEEALSKAKIKVFDLQGTYSAVGRPLYTGVVIDTNASDPNLVSSLLYALINEGRLVALPAPVMFGPGSTMYTPSATAMGVAPGTIVKDDAFIFVGEKPIAIKESAKAQRK